MTVDKKIKIEKIPTQHNILIPFISNFLLSCSNRKKLFFAILTIDAKILSPTTHLKFCSLILFLKVCYVDTISNFLRVGVESFTKGRALETAQIVNKLTLKGLILGSRTRFSCFLGYETLGMRENGRKYHYVVRIYCFENSNKEIIRVYSFFFKLVLEIFR